MESKVKNWKNQKRVVPVAYSYQSKHVRIDHDKKLHNSELSIMFILNKRTFEMAVCTYVKAESRLLSDVIS